MALNAVHLINLTDNSSYIFMGAALTYIFSLNIQNLLQHTSSLDFVNAIPKQTNQINEIQCRKVHVKLTCVNQR